MRADWAIGGARAASPGGGRGRFGCTAWAACTGRGDDARQVARCTARGVGLLRSQAVIAARGAGTGARHAARTEGGGKLVMRALMASDAAQPDAARHRRRSAGRGRSLRLRGIGRHRACNGSGTAPGCPGRRRSTCRRPASWRDRRPAGTVRPVRRCCHLLAPERAGYCARGGRGSPSGSTSRPALIGGPYRRDAPRRPRCKRWVFLRVQTQRSTVGAGGRAGGFLFAGVGDGIRDRSCGEPLRN